MQDVTMRKASLLCGVLILVFNLYWLERFNFDWNVFTMESYVMTIVGCLLIVPYHQKKVNANKLIQIEVAKQVRKILSESEHVSRSQKESNTPQKNPVHETENEYKPTTNDVGSPDDEGYEWITSGDGRNWYRTLGTTEEWVEYSN